MKNLETKITLNIEIEDLEINSELNKLLLEKAISIDCLII